VAEWGEPDRVDLTFSVTKSFLSSTVGLAWDRKMIPDLNAKVTDYVKKGEFDSEHNAKITWDHLLRQTSDWEGTLWGKPDWSDRPPAGHSHRGIQETRPQRTGDVVQVQRRAGERAGLRRPPGLASAPADERGDALATECRVAILLRLYLPRRLSGGRAMGSAP
jgi:CubicO group peptidase (beta-lactamase class C family)